MNINKMNTVVSLKGRVAIVTNATSEFAQGNYGIAKTATFNLMRLLANKSNNTDIKINALEAYVDTFKLKGAVPHHILEKLTSEIMILCTDNAPNFISWGQIQIYVNHQTQN